MQCRRRKRLYVLALLLTAVSTAVSSQAGWPEPQLRKTAPGNRWERAGSSLADSVESPILQPLNRLVEELLSNNPAIRGALRKWQASSKRPSQVAALPNPELQISSMGGSNPIPFSNWKAEPLNWSGVMFQQKVPWPGKRRLKGEIASIETDLEAYQYRRLTLETVSQLKEAYFQLQFLDRSAEILQRYRRLLDNFARVAEARYGVGEGLQTDVLRAQVQISLMVERLEVLEGRREMVKARVNALLNRKPEENLPVPNPIQDIFIPLSFSIQELLLASRESNPDLQMHRLEIRKANARFSFSKKQIFPDLTFSVGYFLRPDPLANMYEYRVGMEVPLFYSKKERLTVEESALIRERSGLDYQGKLQEVVFRIKDAYTSARTASRLTRLYQQGIIPQATAALDSALASYEVGAVDYFALMENALTLLNYELQYQEELRNYFQSLVRLEALVDVALVR